MKIRQIIVMVQSFGHFDRINFLKLFPEVNLRDANWRFTFGQSFRKLILSKCPNVWTITMIYRIFMTFREYVTVPKMYRDNQLSNCIDISWRYPFRLSFRKIVLSTNYYKIMIGSLTSADILLKRTSIRKSSVHPSISRIPFLCSVGSPFFYFILIKSIQVLY